MRYERVLGVYKRSVFLGYLKSFTPEFSHGNPYTPKAVNLEGNQDLIIGAELDNFTMLLLQQARIVAQ